MKEVFVPLRHHLYSRASSGPLNNLSGCDGTEGIEDAEERNSIRYEQDSEPQMNFFISGCLCESKPSQPPLVTPPPQICDTHRRQCRILVLHKLACTCISCDGGRFHSLFHPAVEKAALAWRHRSRQARSDYAVAALTSAIFIIMEYTHEINRGRCRPHNGNFSTALFQHG